MKLPIYMDNHATTAVDPRVLEEMLPAFAEQYGNAASRNHRFGWEAAELVDRARERAAAVINADPREIIFTSGATESNNMAIKGVAVMYRERGDHIITCVTEHKAVLDTCKALEREGFRVTYLPVDRQGLLDPADLLKAVTDSTILVSVMFANNEIGVIQPIAEIGRIARKHGIFLHCDAVQAVGKVPVDVQELGVDLLSVSAHKVYGPKGVGCLFVRRKDPRVRLTPLIDGGGHERGMRSGTLNVSGIVGLGKCLEIAAAEMTEESARLRRLRDRLHQGITSRLEDVYLNGHPSRRLPNNLNLSFAYVEGESLLMSMNDVAVSSGSACTSATLEPSYVLKALNVPDELAHTSIRFGLGRFNTEEEVDYTIGRVIESVTRLREMSPLYQMAKSGVDLSKVEWKHS